MTASIFPKASTYHAAGPADIGYRLKYSVQTQLISPSMDLFDQFPLLDVDQRYHPTPLTYFVE